MSIERMKAVWLFAPGREPGAVLERLARMGLGHVADCGVAGSAEAAKLGIVPVAPAERELQARVQMLRETFEILSGYARTSREFLENFITTPVERRADEVRRALADVDVAQLHEEAKVRERRRAALLAEVQKAQERLRVLAVLEPYDVLVTGRASQQRVACWLALMSSSDFARLQANERVAREGAAIAAARVGRQVVVQVAVPAPLREAFAVILRELRADVVEPEPETLSARDYLVRRRQELEAVRVQLDQLTEEMRQMARDQRRRVEGVLGYWEERLNVADAAARMARSKRLTIARCYVRTRDLPVFRQRVDAELPGAALVVRDPQPGEAVPVSLRNPRLFAPAQFLVNMFGLPDYFALDPTPVIFFSFLLFFGMCFGDFVYGILLSACALLLARKYREYPNLKHFFQLLALAGLPTAIVGLLTGAWAADVLKYFGEQNFMLKFANRLMVADPVDKALVILVLCLGLGMLNQLLGIVMSMVRNVRQGDVKAAIFDGGFWLLLLPGFVILAAGFFAAVPATLTRVALGLVATGGLGLVLTQGRAEKSLVGKIVIGVVSLYGIVGSYGVTAFVGDTLSYSRLLALGLTTGIVGMCFNMIAGMARGIAWVGPLIFVVILVVGHVLNFLLSILGGFVHSARLTFVEFFGRFYQGGAPRFTPLGAWQGRLRVTDADTVWTE